MHPPCKTTGMLLASALLWHCADLSAESARELPSVRDEATDALSATADAAPHGTCPGQAEFDLAVSGEGLESLNGKTVWVVAVEPETLEENGEWRTENHVAAVLTDEVHRGRFAVSCDNVLSTNYYYAFVFAVVDANGDGVCSPGDRLNRSAQYYGWSYDMDISLPASTDPFDGWEDLDENSGVGVHNEGPCQFGF